MSHYPFNPFTSLNHYSAEANQIFDQAKRGSYDQVCDKSATLVGCHLCGPEIDPTYVSLVVEVGPQRRKTPSSVENPPDPNCVSALIPWAVPPYETTPPRPPQEPNTPPQYVSAH